MSVSLRGDLDYDTSDDVLQRVHSALHEQRDAKALRLDCADLKMIDSMGLSTLLQLQRTASRSGITFHLDNIGPALKQLLDMTGTYEYLTGGPDRT
ncbi:STAS domain-containing protein [Streptomyces flavofungini]|uniref:STAS domain-containing protein n=1 Tax=Streptomyces flavofungini TaxID=68200 RepID=UPI0034DF9991